MWVYTHLYVHVFGGQRMVPSVFLYYSPLFHWSRVSLWMGLLFFSQVGSQQSLVILLSRPSCWSYRNVWNIYLVRLGAELWSLIIKIGQQEFITQWSLFLVLIYDFFSLYYFLIFCYIFSKPIFWYFMFPTSMFLLAFITIDIFSQTGSIFKFYVMFYALYFRVVKFINIYLNWFAYGFLEFCLRFFFKQGWEMGQLFKCLLSNQVNPGLFLQHTPQKLDMMACVCNCHAQRIDPWSSLASQWAEKVNFRFNEWLWIKK